MGDRVAVIKAGVLQQVGEPAVPLRQPGQHLRRRLHRLPADEHGRGQARAAAATTSRCSSASATLPLHDERVAERPALADYVGRDDRRRHPQRGHGGRQPGTRRAGGLPAAGDRSSLTEALGSEIVVHFDVDAPKVVTEDTKLLEKDAAPPDVPDQRTRRPVRGLVRARAPGSGSATRSRSSSTPSGCTSSTRPPAGDPRLTLLPTVPLPVGSADVPQRQPVARRCEACRARPVRACLGRPACRPAGPLGTLVTPGWAW